MKNGSIEATPLDRMFHGPGKTQMNNPTSNRNAEMTTYPINELKKLRISFKISAFILLVRYFNCEMYDTASGAEENNFFVTGQTSPKS